jgi:nucleotide-binding universal stress UspA family protein
MKTLLIPVDFSETSSNAIEYAVGMMKDVDIHRIILLKTLYKSYYEQILPSADFVQLSAADIENERIEVDRQLSELTERLKGKCSRSVELEIETSDLPLLRSIVDLIEARQPDLLVLGCDNPDASEESYIGQLIIPIAKASAVPVLVIPAQVNYSKIRTTLIPCDFRKVSRLAVIQGLDSPLAWMHPELVILNVDRRQEYLDQEQQHLSSLKPLLGGYTYSIHYVAELDIVSGILNFADAEDVQMITALPGKYSFFSALTHKSTTEALALNARHPVLILK